MNIAWLVLVVLVASLCSLPSAAQEVATHVSPTLPGLMPPIAEVKNSRFDDDDDRAVGRALEKRITLRLDSVPLSEAFRQLSRQLGITILLDPQGLEEASVTPDQLVNFQLSNARARNALRLFLEPLNLTIIVKHGVLRITSVEKAAEQLTTRVYNVRDLVQSVSKPVGYALPVPQGTRVYYGGRAPGGGGIEEDFDTLIDLITSTIQPDSWTDNGGQGSISGFPRGLLVVSQTEDFHEELQELLNHMRSAIGHVGVTLP